MSFSHVPNTYACASRICIPSCCPSDKRGTGKRLQPWLLRWHHLHLKLRQAFFWRSQLGRRAQRASVSMQGPGHIVGGGFGAGVPCSPVSSSDDSAERLQPRALFPVIAALCPLVKWSRTEAAEARPHLLGPCTVACRVWSCGFWCGLWVGVGVWKVICFARF